jgi:hypothetical protein
MKTFDFYKDEKHTIWVRTNFNVQAESYEQALEKIKENPIESYENEINWEYLEETLESMDPADNNGEATCEIYSEDTDKLIYTNETKTN